jgi:hypothetical protein
MSDMSPREAFEELMKVGFVVGGRDEDVTHRSVGRSRHLEERTGKMRIMRADTEVKKHMILERLAQHFGYRFVKE